MVVATGWGRGDMELVFNEDGVSVRKIKNFWRRMRMIAVQQCKYS